MGFEQFQTFFEQSAAQGEFRRRFVVLGRVLARCLAQASRARYILKSARRQLYRLFYHGGVDLAAVPQYAPEHGN